VRGAKARNRQRNQDRLKRRFSIFKVWSLESSVVAGIPTGGKVSGPSGREPVLVHREFSGVAKDEVNPWPGAQLPQGHSHLR
jgi:hypothetical protein